MKTSSDRNPLFNEVYTSILPYLTKLVEEAPVYGNCGLTFHLHSGRVSRIETNIGISLKPEFQEHTRN
jgi:hypothetical protein